MKLVSKFQVAAAAAAAKNRWIVNCKDVDKNAAAHDKRDHGGKKSGDCNGHIQCRIKHTGICQTIAMWETAMLDMAKTFV